MQTSRRSFLVGVGLAGLGIAIPETVHASFANWSPGRPPRFRSARSVRAPDRRATLAMRMICDAVGMERTIALFSANITKRNVLAFATTWRGKRYIVYDRVRVPWPETNIPWSSMLVMAHEVGHHVAGHIHRRDIAGKSGELEADRFAGFALARLGASEGQTLSFFSWDWAASSSHPSARARREATREGWNLGERLKEREARSLAQ